MKINEYQNISSIDDASFLVASGGGVTGKFTGSKLKEIINSTSSSNVETYVAVHKEELRGAKGDKGDKGDTGATGPQGQSGNPWGGGTFTGSITAPRVYGGGHAAIWTDGEGGNLSLVSPNGILEMQADCWSNGAFRIYLNENNANGIRSTLHMIPDYRMFTSCRLLGLGGDPFGENPKLYVYSHNGYDGESRATICTDGGVDGITFRPGLSENCNISVVGSIIYTQSCYQWSSERFKKNITPITDEAGDMIMDLEPVEFDYKSTDTHSAGFIAEKVKPLFPELIYYDNGEITGLNYVGFIPYLTKKIQMQQKEIDWLKAENQALLNRISRIEEMIGIKDCTCESE